MTDSRSLLATTHSLRSSLLSSFPPDLDPVDSHSLSQLSPSVIPSLRSRLTTTLETLRTSLESFKQILPPSTTVTGTITNEERERERGDRFKWLDKYLTLLNQSSQTLSNLLSLTSSSTTATLGESERERGGNYPILHPEERNLQSLLLLPILERISKDLGLVSFRDDDDEQDEQQNEQEKEEREKVVTLSLGGKVMVIDFKVHRTRTREWIDTTSSNTGGNASGIKVAYVFKNEQFYNEKSSSKLLSIFKLYQQQQQQGKGGGGEEEEELLWSRVWKVLKELEQLDDRTSREEINYFEKLDRLIDSVEIEFKPLLLEDIISYDSNDNSLNLSKELPTILPNSSSLYPSLLISISPSALLHPSTRQFLSTSSTTSSSEKSGTDLEDFLRVQGVYVVEIGLPDSGSSGRGWYQVKPVSRFIGGGRRGIPISREIGKRIEEVIGVNTSSSASLNGEVKVNGSGPEGLEMRIKTAGGGGGEKRKRVFQAGNTMTDLIMLHSSWSTLPPSRSNEEDRYSPTTHTISFDPSSPASPSNARSPLLPNSFRFQLATKVGRKDRQRQLDDIEREEVGEEEEGGRRSKGFLLNNLWIPEEREEQEAGGGAGDGMKKLRKSIEILNEQIRINDLVFSVINPSTRDEEISTTSTTTIGGERGDSNRRSRSTKKRKLEKDKESMSMSLEDLFENTSSKLRTPLPVFIHLDDDNSQPPGTTSTNHDPSILISFPSPHLPPQEATPITITITSTREGGYSYTVETRLEKVKDRLEIEKEVYEKGIKVLELTRDLGIFFNWVVKELASEKEGEQTQ